MDSCVYTQVSSDHHSGKVLHFASPKVHAQTSGNTVAVYGTAQEKDLQEIPNVISQLGADSLLSMQKMVHRSAFDLF